MIVCYKYSKMLLTAINYLSIDDFGQTHYDSLLKMTNNIELLCYNYADKH
jgi:hypothetical protein